MSDSPARQIDDYVRRLKWSLQGLDPADRAAIGTEIHGHLTECAAQGDTGLAAALAGLGSPYSLARRYLEENDLAAAIGRKGPGRLLLAIVDRAGRSAIALGAAFVALTLYLFTVTFGVVVLAKPIVPGRVGVWHGVGGWQAGLVAAPPAGGVDLLGFWIMPIGVALALCCYTAGTQVLRRTGTRMLHRAM